MEKAKASLRAHSTLWALIALMVLFEILARAFSFEVREIYGDYTSGRAGWGDLASSVWSSLTSSHMSFLNPRNLTNVMLQVSLNGLLAVGMTLVILSAGIDLSVGSLVALTGVVLGLMDRRWGHAPLFLALAVTLGSGFLMGAVNGVLISRFDIPPFVITLGMLVIARGLALILSDSTAISPLSAGIRFLGGGFIDGWWAIGFLALPAALLWRSIRGSEHPPAAEGGKLSRVPWLSVGALAAVGLAATYVFVTDRGIPFPVVLMAAATAIGVVVTRATTFGRAVYAIGGNETAAVLAGIPVNRTKFWVYALMGLLSAVSGIVLAGRLNSAAPTEGQLMELDAIAAVVIGGTSLRGGIGGVQGSILGTLIIGTLNNGMDLIGISSNWQMVMKGLIIIVAVYSDARMRRAG